MNKRTKDAQRTRRQIAGTFERMSTYDVTAHEILHETPACLKRMRVYDVVRRFPHMGGDGASNVLKRAKVWPLTRMGQLNDEERVAILNELPPRARVLPKKA